jgi:hypothetical protein
MVHSSHGKDTVEKLKPAEQNKHCADCKAFSCWYFPDMHDEHAWDLFVNSNPAGQKMHKADAAAFSCWYLPAAQA